VDLNSFPKSYGANMAWRREMLRKAAEDYAFRARVKELFHRSVHFAFNAFFFTLDVRRRPQQHQPFATYGFQDEFLIGLCDAVERGDDFPGDKSRDMGATWLVLGAFVWYWLNPKGGYDFLCGSRIEDYVDKRGDPRTHFEKMRYLLRKLPKWLLPKGFRWKKHDNFMRLVNPETGAAITGESNNPNFSTQGRYAAVLFDEFAKWEGTDEKAWTSAGDATPCRIAVSTPFGAGGMFYKLMHGLGKGRFHLHWSRHPLKAEGGYCNWPREKRLDVYEGEELLERSWRSKWYDFQCERRKSDQEIAQEVDIDYIGAGSMVFDGKAAFRIKTLRKCEREIAAWFEVDLAEMRLAETDARRDAEGFWLMWRKPQVGCGYAFGVDVVEGVEEGDYAVIKVVNRETKDVDASYYSRIDEATLARIVAAGASYFTVDEAPWVGIETIGPGLSTFDLCETLGVENLFMMPTYDSARESVSYKKGFRTNAASKNKLITGIREWLLDEKGWGDLRLCGELLTFVRSATGKAGAKEGEHDDEVMAFGIALQVDIIAPEMVVGEKGEVREDGVPVETFDLGKLREEGEPETLEEKCLAQALKKRAGAESFAIEKAFWEEVSDGLFESFG